MAAANSSGVITHAHTALSAANQAAHDAGTHYRLPRRIPVAPSSAVSAAELHLTTEVAYLEREQQLAQQVRYELAAGGLL